MGNGSALRINRQVASYHDLQEKKLPTQRIESVYYTVSSGLLNNRCYITTIRIVLRRA